MNYKSIKFKLVALTIVGLIILGVSISFVAIDKSSNALVQARMDQLKSVAVGKAESLTEYTEMLSGLIRSMARDINTVETLWYISDGFDALEEDIGKDINNTVVIKNLEKNYQSEYINKINFKFPNVEAKRNVDAYLPQSTNAKLAQELYIVENKNKEKNKFNQNKNYKDDYSKQHALYHRKFKAIMDQFGMDDVLLINGDANIVYTTAKNKDLGTNLLTGPYKHSSLARIYKKAAKAKLGKVIFSDFIPYEPTFNEPTAFIATPLYFHEDIEGVLVFELPIDKINKIMNFGGKFEEVGLGKTGEAFFSW